MLVHVTLTLVSRTPLKDQQLRPVPTVQRSWRDDETFVVTQGADDWVRRGPSLP